MKSPAFAKNIGGLPVEEIFIAEHRRYQDSCSRRTELHAYVLYQACPPLIDECEWKKHRITAELLDQQRTLDRRRRIDPLSIKKFDPRRDAGIQETIFALWIARDPQASSMLEL